MSSLTVLRGHTFDTTGTVTLRGSTATGKVPETLYDAGVITNAGTLILMSGAPAGSGPGATGQIVAGGVLSNAGKLIIGTNSYSGGPARFQVAAGGTLTNDAGSDISVNGVSTLSIEGALLNQGSIEIHSWLHGNASTPGLLAIAATGRLVNGGSIQIDSGSLGSQGGYGPTPAGTLEDAGVVVTAGTMALLGGEIGDTVGELAATQSAAAQLAVQAQGRLTNSGVIVLRQGAWLTVYTQFNKNSTIVSASGAGLTIGGLATNEGTIIADPTLAPTGSGGGVIEVLAGGTFVNHGLVEIGGTMSDDGLTTNTGAIVLLAGQPQAKSGASIHPGSALTIGSGGTLVNGGNVTIEAAAPASGTQGVAGGASLTVDGTFRNAGLIIVGGTAGSAQNGAVFVASGGTLVSSGGAIRDDGTFVVAGGSDLGSFELGCGSALFLNGSLIDNGYVLVSGFLGDQGVLTGSGVLRIGGELTADAASQAISLSVRTVLNDGVIAVGHGTTLHIGHAVLNDPGVTGTIALAAQSGVTFASTVAAGETLVFAASAGDYLSIGTLAVFHGLLAGLAAGDTVDLRNVTSNRAMFAHGALTLSETTPATTETVGTLRLTGSYPSCQFQLAGDGHDGTLVTLRESHAG